MATAFFDGYHERVFESTSEPHVLIYPNVQTADYATHWHTPIEILMPVENSYTAYVNHKKYVLQPYDILFIMPNVYHSCEAPDSGKRYFIQADLSILKDIFSFNQILSMLSPAALFTPLSTPAIHQPIKERILAICDAYFNQHNYQVSHADQDVDLRESVIYQLILEVLNLAALHYNNAGIRTLPPTVSPGKQQQYVNKFAMICNYIDTHCTENLSLDDMAKLSNFSKFHFSRLFKDYTQESFYKYVNKKRIQYAEQLLIHQDMSVTDIALSSGYSNTSSFIRMFRQINGCTPKKYREDKLKDSFKI